MRLKLRNVPVFVFDLKLPTKFFERIKQITNETTICLKHSLHFLEFIFVLEQNYFTNAAIL